MNNISFFSRNRRTDVNQIDADTLISSCRINDPVTNAYVEITVKLPDLEIKDAQGKILSMDKKKAVSLTDSLESLKGMRIGPGMLKIIKGTIGASSDNKEVIYMVEECCHGVILLFTKEALLAGMPEKVSDVSGYYKKMVKKNIRMYNRCAAFAPGSPLVEGLEPPAK